MKIAKFASFFLAGTCMVLGHATQVKQVNLKLVNSLIGQYRLNEGVFGNCKGPLSIKKAPLFVNVISSEFQDQENKSLPCINGLEINIDHKPVAYLCNWNQEKRIPHSYKKLDWVYEASMKEPEAGKPLSIYLWQGQEGYRRAILEPVWGTVNAQITELEISLDAQNKPQTVKYRYRQTPRDYAKVESVHSCVYKK